MSTFNFLPAWNKLALFVS